MTPPVFTPGDKVWLAEGRIPGQVISCEYFNDDAWTYDVTWWHESEKRLTTFYAFELEKRDDQNNKATSGFR